MASSFSDTTDHSFLQKNCEFCVTFR